MRNKRFFVVLAGALVFGLVAAVTVSRYLSSAQAYSRDLEPRGRREGRDSCGNEDHSRTGYGGPVFKRIDTRWRI